MLGLLQSGKAVSRSFVLLGGLLLTMGCGSSQGTVTGKVSYQGKLLKGGTISFISTKGGVVTSSIHEDGSYTVSRVPVGPATITVSTSRFRPPPKGEKQMMMPPPKGEKQTMMPPPLPPEMIPKVDAAELERRYVPIPEKYSDFQNSGLTYTVQNGKQEYNIDLK
jgi:hypothetical protein